MHTLFVFFSPLEKGSSNGENIAISGRNVFFIKIPPKQDPSPAVILLQIQFLQLSDSLDKTAKTDPIILHYIII